MSEIPDFLSEEECQTIINRASKAGLDTSEVQDPETGINIEPTNKATFHSWDYNSDGVIDKVEVEVVDNAILNLLAFFSRCSLDIPQVLVSGYLL